MGDQRPVTLQEVAVKAGVSVGTVSRVLSGRGELARPTRDRVIAAATELGYDRASNRRGRPNTLDPRLIELVLGSFDDAWTDAVASGARDAAFKLGFDLVLTLERPDPSDDWPARIANRRPSGVVIGIIRPTAQQLGELRGLRIPVVLLEPRSEPGEELPSVGTTDWQGGYDAGAHLAHSPVERFVIVTGVPAYRFGRARESGFRQALADHRPDAEIVHVDSRWSSAAADTALMNALAGSAPVGVFACNDRMALVVYRAAAQLKRRIPEDISVIGFDDEPRALTAVPPLTTVRQPLRAMGARAVELIHEMRQHTAAAVGRVELPSELIVRGSTLQSTAVNRTA